jgi:hypothetical protein
MIEPYQLDCEFVKVHGHQVSNQYMIWIGFSHLNAIPSKSNNIVAIILDYAKCNAEAEEI